MDPKLGFFTQPVHPPSRTCDPLCDDSLFLAPRLAAAHGEVDLAVYPDSPHGFMALPTEMAKELAKAHHARVAPWIRHDLGAAVCAAGGRDPRLRQFATLL